MLARPILIPTKLKNILLEFKRIGRCCIFIATAFFITVPLLKSQDALQRTVDAYLNEGREFVATRVFDDRTDRSYAALTKYAVPEEALAAGTVVFPEEEAAAKVREKKPQFTSMTIPGPEGGELSLLLFRKSPFAPDAIIQSGEIEVESLKSQTAFYRGVVEGHPGSMAVVTLFDDEIRASISFEGVTYVLGKIKGAEDGAHVFYRADDLAIPETFSCQLRDDHIDDKVESATETEIADRTLKCVRIKVEIDNALTASLGGEASAVNYASGLWNEVTALFDNDDIDVVVSEIVAYTGSSPYSGSVGDRLDQMTNNSANADLTALITDVGGGGVAYLSSVCSFSLGVSVSSIFGFYNNVPSYSWDVYVCAHEIGHNLSSDHTHACAWNGNNTPIDGCGITAGFPEGSCGNSTIPSGGGTVMSYCHLNNVGINFNAGFGPQPSTRIINYVNSRSCLGSSCTPFGGITCDEELLALEITVDQYPSETTWQITDDNDAVLASGGPYPGLANGAVVTEEICLPQDCYSFTIFDSFGDGICCAYGNGSYTLQDSDGAVLASGGAFDNTESTEFCVGDFTPPVPCESPYPQVQNLVAGVTSGGVLLAWDPIPGSLGCQIQGGRVGSTSLKLVQTIQPDLSTFFIPSGQLPINGGYRVRVRCGCSISPAIGGPWTPYTEFAWNNASGTPQPTEGIFEEATLEVQAFPNPTAGEISLSMIAGEEEVFLVRVFDLPGKLVHSERILAAAGSNMFRVDLSHLGEAVYLLQVAGVQGGVHSMRIAVAK